MWDAFNDWMSYVDRFREADELGGLREIAAAETTLRRVASSGTCLRQQPTLPGQQVTWVSVKTLREKSLVLILCIVQWRLSILILYWIDNGFVTKFLCGIFRYSSLGMYGNPQLDALPDLDTGYNAESEEPPMFPPNSLGRDEREESRSRPRRSVPSTLLPHVGSAGQTGNSN